MVVMMLHKYSRAAVVHVTQLTHNGKTSKQGSTDLCANAKGFEFLAYGLTWGEKRALR